MRCWCWVRHRAPRHRGGPDSAGSLGAPGGTSTGVPSVPGVPAGTPERGRYLHKAIDIVHNPRSVVWASARGKVIIKDRYLMSGNTVVIDHGMGVHSLYYHLHDFADIEVGDVVNKGAKIGRLGKTGYATGYHLHWAIHVNNVAVDPLEWTEAKA